MDQIHLSPTVDQIQLILGHISNSDVEGSIVRQYAIALTVKRTPPRFPRSVPSREIFSEFLPPEA
jgi:hypothetical protein